MSAGPRRSPAAVLLVRLLIVVAAAAPAMAPGSAQAHTDLRTSRPAVGDRVDEVPTHVVLEFARPVALDDAPVELTGPHGEQPVSAVLLSQDRRVVSVVLTPPGDVATTGAWTVRYRVRGDDGHVIAGTVDFGVNALADPRDAPLSASTASAIALSVLAAVVMVLRSWSRRTAEVP